MVVYRVHSGFQIDERVFHIGNFVNFYCLLVLFVIRGSIVLVVSHNEGLALFKLVGIGLSLINTSLVYI